MSDSKKTKAELEAELAELQAKFEEMSRKNAELASKASSLMPSRPASSTDDVTLVYLSDSPGYIAAGNVQLNATRMGEEFIVQRRDFDAIVGKYRSFFDMGILAVADADVAVAVAKGLKTASEYGISAKKLEQLAEMTASELEDFWHSLIGDAHKISVVTYYKKKFIEGTDVRFRDMAKLDALNRLTGGAFESERDALRGKWKIEPTVISLKPDED